MSEAKEALPKKVRYLKDIQGLSFRQMEQEFAIPRVKCSRLYSGNRRSQIARVKILDSYRALIAEWYKQHPTLTAAQVFERLRERDVAVSYQSVTLYTKGFRRKKEKCYLPLTFHPGEEAQVDWFFLNHPHLGKLSGFAFILSYSRFLFAHFFPRHSFEFFIQGHLMAFGSIEGLPRALRYDNLSSVVLKREPLTYNPAFLEFAYHYSFEIRLCNPAAGNEKGRVERVIRTIRTDFCNIAEHHQSLDALNQALQEWTKKKNHTVHRSTGEPPAKLITQETLKPFPDQPWRNVVVHPPKQVSKMGLLTLDTNRYSVPENFVGQLLTLHAFCDRIEIYGAKGNKVATHKRCFDRNKTFINPLHRSFTRISSEAKKERIYNVIKNMDIAIERFLEQNQRIGENPYVSAHTIFSLLRTHSRQTVLSAIREANAAAMPRIKTLISLLTVSTADQIEEVMPQQSRLLELDYRPRTLEEYEP